MNARANARPHARPHLEAAPSPSINGGCPPRSFTSRRASRPSERQLDSLVALPYPAFARLVAHLLTSMGYKDVRLMGAGPGRNSYGGHDLRARLAGPLSSSLMAVQAKQYRAPVPRCYVDELRGTMLRIGASHGALIATSRFSPAALEAVASAQDVLPVRLVDGPELLRLMAEHGVSGHGISGLPSQAVVERDSPSPGIPYAPVRRPLAEADRAANLSVTVQVDVRPASSGGPDNGGPGRFGPRGTGL